MNKYLLITFIALLTLVVAIPLYWIAEPVRLEISQADLRQEFVSDAAPLYVENCAICHGANGEGIAAVPALNDDGIRTADYDFLFKTIERGRYDTAMAAWHVDEGGIFNDYQIDELVTFIRYVDWEQVNELSAERGLIPATLPIPEVDDDFLAQVAALDSEFGETWAAGMQIYAENCTTCHGVNGEGSSLAVPLNTDEVRAISNVELIRTVTEGVPSTMMPAWDNSLAADDIEKVVSFIENWDVISGTGLEMIPPAPVQIDLNNPEAVLALGKNIFDNTCSVCHGEDGSGGTGPALNSQQVLTSVTDEQIRSTVITGRRSMPSFGDRLTSVEIDAVVDYVRSWEPTAPYVENPRGTDQGGGPPWMRATPDSENPVDPNAESSSQRGGPRWRK